VYSFRYAPGSYRQQVENNPVLTEETEKYLDLINQRIADEVQASGVAFVMTSSVRNRTVMRFSICSHRTTLADIEQVFELIQQVAREMDNGRLKPIRVTR
jgi:aromatic-L-amino-acid decarboxylase